MSGTIDPKEIESRPKGISRRDFIKGVIASGAAVSSAGYLFRASTWRANCWQHRRTAHHH